MWGDSESALKIRRSNITSTAGTPGALLEKSRNSSVELLCIKHARLGKLEYLVCKVLCFGVLFLLKSLISYINTVIRQKFKDMIMTTIIKCPNGANPTSARTLELNWT